jgi:hypothetical protein
MKKVFLVIFTVFLTMQVSAFDLWNGFTTEMGRNEVIARVNSLQLGQITDESTNSFSTRLGIFADGRDQFPQERRIYIKSSQPQYYSRFEKSNIDFYFYQNKLYCVSILWTASLEDLLARAKEQYKNHTETITENGKFNDGTP